MLYPFSYDRGDGYGPDRLCDVIDCPLCVGHACDCDVCTDRLKALSLKVLHDSQESGNRKRSPNWKEIEMAEDLMEMLAKVKPGDFVTAFGKDTRGHEVTRTGTLLAQPEDMKATHNGRKMKAVRVRVGERGSDPAARSTWTTLIPGHGTIRATEPPQSGVWTNGQLGKVPGVREGSPSLRVHFGGKGGKRSQEPMEPVVLAGVRHIGDGRYEIFDVDDDAVLLTGTLQTQIWWAHAPEADEHQDQEPEAGEDDQEQADHESEREPERFLGKPVHHLVTGQLVGYWAPHKFTPIEEIRG
ncbi:hypothetical protein ABZ791_10860 [Streptomyces huasconensis]|uniref:Uncharacterized protein n=1 Tax=Streptomyces huasconensis TaxID=1854574 RepID=A0ABV3LSM8_9ACTN